MRIGSNSPDLHNVSNDSPVNSTGTAATTRLAQNEDGDSFPEDTVTISSLAQRAMQSPDTRHDLVSSLQQSVSHGEYELDPSAIAAAMLLP